MKKWEKPQINTLGAEKTNQTKDAPHYWKCTACGKHHYGTWFIVPIPPQICGYNECQGKDFEWVPCEEEVIPGGGES